MTRMKRLLLIFSLFISSSALWAQNNQVNNLPAGRYETSIKQNGNKWTKGDIVLLDDSHYKITSSTDVGEYKFSATAQRIFFTSGPLKTVFAKAIVSADKPAIILPAAENEQGLKLAGEDVIAYLRN
jgi:hypothetical protein